MLLATLLHLLLLRAYFVILGAGTDLSYLSEILGPSQEESPMQSASGITFRRSEPGEFIDWHPAPRRQYVITLAGQVEIGIGDGTVRLFGPGDVLLAEDLTGRGHTTRAVGTESRISAAIPLTE